MIAEKKSQLKALRNDSKRNGTNGRYNWGDFHRNQHIKELVREIQILKSTPK